MATTSLGRLTLDLLVKLGSFEQGMNQAERVTREKTDKMNKAVTSFKTQISEALGGTQFGSLIDGFNSKLGSLSGGIGVASAALAGMAVGGVAVAFGALSKMAIDAAKADAQLAMLANRANTSVQSFQTLQYAAAGFGVNQEQLGGILADVQEKLGEFSATQGGEAADFFDALKNNTKMTEDQIKQFGKTLQGKDGVEAIQLINNKLDDLGATSQERRFIFESLANDLGNLAPLFAENGKMLDEYGEALEEAGILKTKESMEQSRLLAAQTQSVQARFEGFKSQLSGQMMPVLNSLLSHFLDGVNKGGQFGSVIQSVGVIAKGVGVVIIGVAATIQGLIKIITGFVQQGANIAQTATNVWNADGAKAKAAALGAGFQEAGNIIKTTFTDITNDAKQAMEGMGSVIDSSAPKLDKLGQLLYKNGDAANQSAKGIATDTKTAEENAKAKEKAAKATSDAAKAQENYNKIVGASALTGLKIKSAESIAGGQVRGYTAEFAKLTQDALGSSLNRFTAFNDAYHKGTNSKHAVGQAFDYTVKDASEADASIARLQEVANKYGFVINAINEYTKPSGRSTGGHVHVSVLGFKGTKDMMQNAQAELSIINQAKEEEKRLKEEKDRQQLEVRRQYFTEEQKMEHEHEEAKKAIQIAYAGDDAAIAKYLALQEQFYAKDVAEYKFAQDQKRIEEQRQILEMQRGWLSAGEYARRYYALVREELKKTQGISPAKLNAGIRQADQEEGIAQYAEKEQAAQEFDSRFGIVNEFQESMSVLDNALKHNLITEQRYYMERAKLQVQWGKSYVSGAAGVMAQVFGEQSAAYQAMFAVQKALAVAEVMLNAPKTFSAVLANASNIPVVGPFIAPGLAAGAVAMQMAQAAMIGSVSFNPVGMAHDGIANIPQEGTWLLDKGERVLNPQQNRDLTNYLAQKAYQESQPAPAAPQVQQPIYINALDGKSVERVLKKNGRHVAGSVKGYARNFGR